MVCQNPGCFEQGYPRREGRELVSRPFFVSQDHYFKPYFYLLTKIAFLANLMAENLRYAGYCCRGDLKWKSKALAADHKVRAVWRDLLVISLPLQWKKREERLECIIHSFFLTSRFLSSRWMGEKASCLARWTSRGITVSLSGLRTMGNSGLWVER